MTPLPPRYSGFEWSRQVFTGPESSEECPWSQALGRDLLENVAAVLFKRLLHAWQYLKPSPSPCCWVHWTGHFSLILSPISCALGAPGVPCGLLLPEPQLVTCSSKWQRELGLAATVGTAIRRRAEWPGSQAPELEVLRQPQAEPQCPHPVGPKGLP